MEATVALALGILLLLVLSGAVLAYVLVRQGRVRRERQDMRYPVGYFIGVGMGSSIAIGMALGVALGILIHSLPIGITLGPGLGTTIGVAIGTELERCNMDKIRPPTLDEWRVRRVVANVELTIVVLTWMTFLVLIFAG